MNTIETIKNQAIRGDLSITWQDVASAYFGDMLAGWRAEGIEQRAKQQVDLIAAADTEVAEFVAAVLEENALALQYPRATTFRVGEADAADDELAIVVKPLRATEHTGTGLALGKVQIDFHSVEKTNINVLRDLFAKHTLHGNRASVGVGNYPAHIMEIKNLMLRSPVIARPSAAGLAEDFARAARGLPHGPTGTDNVTVESLARHESVVSTKPGRAVVRGSFTAIPNDRWQGYDINTMVKRLTPIVEGKAGFALNLGVVEKCTLVAIEPQGIGVKITFEAEAVGRFESKGAAAA